MRLRAYATPFARTFVTPDPRRDATMRRECCIQRQAVYPGRVSESHPCRCDECVRAPNHARAVLFSRAPRPLPPNHTPSAPPLSGLPCAHTVELLIAAGERRSPRASGAAAVGVTACLCAMPPSAAVGLPPSARGALFRALVAGLRGTSVCERAAAKASLQRLFAVLGVRTAACARGG